MSTGNGTQLLRAMAPTISVGILTADWMYLDEALAQLHDTGVEVLHFDVMDGCFTPLMTFGPPIIQGVRTNLLKDVHLMIEEPLEKVADYVGSGADMVTVHVESCRHIHRVLQFLGSCTNVNDPQRGIVRGVALNPGTPLAVLEPLLDVVDLITLLAINPGWGGQSFLPSTFGRIEQVREMLQQAGRDTLLCVDGGIKQSNVREVAAAGVDLIVTGSAVFDGRTPHENARRMLAGAREA